MTPHYYVENVTKRQLYGLEIHFSTCSPYNGNTVSCLRSVKNDALTGVKMFQEAFVNVSSV